MGSCELLTAADGAGGLLALVARVVGKTAL
jgi:hypothetical protein